MKEWEWELKERKRYRGNRKIIKRDTKEKTEKWKKRESDKLERNEVIE